MEAISLTWRILKDILTVTAREAWQEEFYRAELVDVSQHVLCDLAGPGAMQEESALEVLHLSEV